MLSQENSPVTPQKTSNESFSPIIIPASPAELVHQKNITGLPRVVRDILADIYNNIQKWNEKHVAGAAIIQQIAVLKRDSSQQLPKGLETLLTNLYDVVHNLTLYCNALLFLKNQTCSLLNMKTHTDPVFIRLSLEQITNLVKGIVTAYEMEFKAKEYVLENIAYATTKEEVMFFSSSWVHQIYITKAVGLKLEILLNETNHRKIV